MSSSDPIPCTREPPPRQVTAGHGWRIAAYGLGFVVLALIACLIVECTRSQGRLVGLENRLQNVLAGYRSQRHLARQLDAARLEISRLRAELESSRPPGSTGDLAPTRPLTRHASP